MQQVERTERVLKSLWRERNQQNRAGPPSTGCSKTVREIRRTAFTILQNLLS